MIQKGWYYKHRNCLDLILFVQRVISENEYEVELDVVYTNDRNFVFGTETIKIKKKDFYLWSKVS